MEKVSGVIPASTRQTWVTGEKERPKRVSDPVLEEGGALPSRALSFPQPTVENAGKQEMPSNKGGKLNRVA